MMTFKEYLIETSIMSKDAHQQSIRDYNQRGIGKTDGSKPKEKRLDQMDKRKDRKAGGRSEEEEVKHGGRHKTPEFLKRQANAGQEEKPKRGHTKLPAMLRRQSGI